VYRHINEEVKGRRIKIDENKEKRDKYEQREGTAAIRGHFYVHRSQLLMYTLVCRP
jgi:hypothetical protein